MSHNISLKDISRILFLIKNKDLTQSSEKLNITPLTFKKLINKAEKLLECQLFTIINKKFIATKDGIALYKKYNIAVQDFKDAFKHYVDTQKIQNEYTNILCLPKYSEYLTQNLDKANTNNISVNIDLYTEYESNNFLTIEHEFKIEKFDFIISETPLTFINEFDWKLPLEIKIHSQFYAHPDFIKQNSLITLDNINNLPIFNDVIELNSTLEVFNKNGSQSTYINCSAPTAADNFYNNVEIAVLGHGIVIFPSFLIPYYNYKESLKLILAEHYLLTHTLYLYTKSEPSRDKQKLIQNIIHIFKKDILQSQ